MPLGRRRSSAVRRQRRDRRPLHLLRRPRLGDLFIGGAGDDRIFGLGGADILAGGGGADMFVYRVASDSSGADYDTIGDFDPALDRIDLPARRSAGFGAAIEGGTLSAASFDDDLAAALGGLGADQAVWFAPDAGDLAGTIFLVVDGNRRRRLSGRRGLCVRDRRRAARRPDRPHRHLHLGLRPQSFRIAISARLPPRSAARRRPCPCAVRSRPMMTSTGTAIGETRSSSTWTIVSCARSSRRARRPTSVIRVARVVPGGLQQQMVGLVAAQHVVDEVGREGDLPARLALARMVALDQPADHRDLAEGALQQVRALRPIRRTRARGCRRENSAAGSAIGSSP